MAEQNGYIYILTNPAFPEFVKIGYADNVEQRISQLNQSECIPYAFRLYATYEVSSRLADKIVHRIIDRINDDLRAVETYKGKVRKREFYAMSADAVYNFFVDITELSGTENKLIKYELNKEEKTEAVEAEKIKNTYQRSRKPLTFSEYQIPIGSELVYVKDPNIKCKVVSETKVEYQGKQYSLSRLASELNVERGFCKSIAGTDVFSYNGERLSIELRARLGI